MNKKKIAKRLLFFALVGSGLSLVGADYAVRSRTADLIYATTDDLPTNKVGLLLGTSKHLKSGSPNQYFDYRIEAASALFESGKIAHMVISGDNGKAGYNEPLDMKNALMDKGIPEGKITLDYAGFRTFDSVVRMKEIFGQTRFTIISQEFHNQRAVYIANALGMEAVGYNARDVDAYNGFKTKLREKFARVKAMMDLLFGKKPKFLGEKILI